MSNNLEELAAWKYRSCPLDTDPAHFGPFSGLVSLWRSRIETGKRLPSRKDFDFFDFKGWWGRVAIAKIERDPFDVRFVLWGTELTEWWGVDYTNHLLGSKSVTPAVWEAVEISYFRSMDAAPFIGVVQGDLTQHERPFIRVIGLDLPLSEDGEELSEVLVLHTRVEQKDTISDILPNAPVSDFD